MIRKWSEIRDRYAEWVDHGLPLGPMLQLVAQIDSSAYANGVYGFTSMFDLGITQSPSAADPPYLRISPMFNGQIEFRYFDTFVGQRQWFRVVKDDEAFARLEKFFEQLHWFSHRSLRL